MATEQTTQDTQAAPKPRRRRRFLIAMVLLVGAVWFAPAIIANTSLRQQLLPTLAPQYPAGIEVGSASLSWTGPVVLRDVTFRDKQDAEFLRVAEIATAESLWQLISNSAGMHPITIKGADADVRFRTDGSNLEDVIMPFADPTSTIWPGVALEITDSRLKMSAPATGAEAIWTDLRVTVQKSHEQGVPYAISASATVENGTLQTELSWLPPAELTSPAAGNGKLALQTKTFPLQTLKPIFERMSLSDELIAELTSDVKTAWNTAGEVPEYQVAGELQTGNLFIKSAAISANEQVQADFLRCVVETTITGEQFNVAHLDIDSDLAKLRIEGEVNVADLTGTNSTTALLSLPKQRDFTLQGRLDLAKLAATLPETLRIREGTKITAGTVDWRLEGAKLDRALGWFGQVSVSRLTAVHDGKSLNWEKPISLDGEATIPDAGGTTIRLNCESDFLKASVQGNPGKATVQAECDLDRLAAEVGRFLDLGELELAGKMVASVDVTRKDNRVAADAAMDIQKLHLAGLGGVAWDESQLKLNCAVDATVGSEANAEFHQGSIQLAATGYQLSAQLDSAAKWNAESKSIPLEIAVRGDLTRIMPRLRTIMPLEDWQADGEVQLQTHLTVSPNTIAYRDAELAITPLRITGPDCNISEPNVRIASSGSYDVNTSQFQSDSTTITTATLNARAQPIAVAFKNGSPQVSATVDFASRIEDLLKIVDSGAAPSAGGELSARLNLSGGDGKHRLQSDIVVDKFVVYDQATSVPNRNVSANIQPAGAASLWNEPRLTVASDVTYETASDSVRIAKMQVNGNKWKATTTGRIDEVATAMNAKLTGALDCDWEQLLAKHRQLIGDGLNISGSGPHPFQLSGPLLTTASASGTSNDTLLSRLDGKLQLSWNSADIYGLQAGQAKIDTRLKSGVFRIAPLDIPVSEGRLTAAPRLLLNSEPMMFVLPAGPVIENVRLSPDMCQGWLKYVAPMLADSTRVDGRLSMAVTSTKVPLDNWQEMKSVGTLAIHSADVRPGPLAQQFLEIAEQIKAIIRKSGSNIINPEEAWMKIDDQTVAFQVSLGRVHHDSLEIRVRDLVIRTRGSVGMDESIDLIAEVPVQDSWIKDDRLLGAFRGEVIQIPISGTLSKPKVDRNIFANLARQVGTSAGTKLLENELQNQLQRLFRK